MSKSSEKSESAGKVIAIRREDASVWERRAALAPKHVRKLTERGVKVLVQPSNRRIYTAQSYEDSGATIQEDISEASVIMCVKEVSIDDLLPDKTYCLFSHTNKAHDVNMPMLDCILERNIRIIDYEALVDDNGKRVVAFGKYAGIAGAINILHGLGVRLLSLGHNTPFLYIGLAHNYRQTFTARQAVREAGYEIALGTMPKSLGPIIFVFAGTGNVSLGSQLVFEELPHEYVEIKDLPEVSRNGYLNKVYGTVVGTKDYLRRIDGGGFDREEFRAHPDRYKSIFAEEIAPYATVIINGLYWESGYPRLLTNSDAKRLLTPTSNPDLVSNLAGFFLPHHLLAICEISAEEEGSFEFVKECTTIDTPFCIYDADQHKHWVPFSGPGVLICSIDNMPTQLPIEATEHFGRLLFPYMDSIISSDATKPLEENKLDRTVRRAIIASNGQLTPEFEYITDLRKKNKKTK